MRHWRLVILVLVDAAWWVLNVGKCKLGAGSGFLGEWKESLSPNVFSWVAWSAQVRETLELGFRELEGIRSLLRVQKGFGDLTGAGFSCDL